MKTTCTYAEMLERFNAEERRYIRNDYEADALDSLRKNRAAFATAYKLMLPTETIGQFDARQVQS